MTWVGTIILNTKSTSKMKTLLIENNFPFQRLIGMALNNRSKNVEPWDLSNQTEHATTVHYLWSPKRMKV
jgi:hypothetical protein